MPIQPEDTSMNNKAGLFNTMDIIANENHSETFLSILDDKNKLIGSLRQQLENQKVQILYYLKKEITYSKVDELSRTCTAENTDSIPVALAVDRFKKENGIKSNLYRLYDYMRHVDCKLTRSLNCQEFILRKIVEKLCQAINNSQTVITNNDANNQSVACLDLFNALLESTVGLKKKLDTFRICCNRLILIEDERNTLVEQVFSLPVDKKLRCNFLISIKQEKSEIERKMEEIKQQHNVQKKDLQQLRVIEGKLSGLRKRLRSSIEEAVDLSSVGEMVQQLNMQAKCLLETSEPRRRKDESKSIIKVVESMMRIAGAGGDIRTNDKRELELFETIKKEMRLFDTKLQEEVLLARKEHDCTKRQLDNALAEKKELQCRLKKLQTAHKADVTSLLKQRDSYKSQLEELEDECVQNVTKPTSKSTNKENELLKTVEHLERKVHLMKEMINKQNKEISLQSDFIENLKGFYGKKRKRDGTITVDRCISGISKEECDASNEIEELANENTAQEIMTYPKEKLCRKTTHTLQASPTNTFKNGSGVVKEIIQTVINDVKLNKKTNMSSFSLEIKCSCKKEGNATKTPQCSNCNELELMRDCSRESLPMFCPPIRKNNENCSDNNKYSRNIEVLVQNNRLHSSSEEYNNVFKNSN